MRYFKYLFIVCAIFLLTGCGASYKGDNSSEFALAESNIVYASDIKFDNGKNNYFVGEEIALNNINITVLPNNATVRPTYSIDDTSVATIINDKIVFNKTGSFKLTASIMIGNNTFKTATTTFTVSIKPIFATDLSFVKDNIIVDLKENAYNNLTILPLDYNCDITVTSVNDCVEYNYITGEIVPIKVGQDIVSVEVSTADHVHISKSFTITVVDNHYAEDITNIKFNNFKVNNSVTMFVGDTGNFTYDVVPSDYNLSRDISISNDTLSIVDGTFTAIKSGECNVTIKVLSKTGELTKSIKVIVKEPINTIDFGLSLDNNNCEEYYTETTYIATINTLLNDYSLITFNNCNFKYISDNQFEITFNTTGNYNITATYNNISDISNKNATSDFTVNVYNPITGINFSLFNEQELLPKDNVYTLYLPSEDYYDRAISEKELVYADINLSYKGVDVKPNCLKYTIVGDSVEVKENKLIAKKLGISRLTIVSNDISNYSISYSINVEPIKVSSINVDNETIDLYINGDKGLDTYQLNYDVEPINAIDKNVEIVCDSDIIEITDNTIIAKCKGSAIISLKCGEVIKNLTINVKYVPTHICAYFDDKIVSDNQELTCELNSSIYLTGSIFSNQIELNDYETIIFVNDKAIVNNSKYIFDSLGKYTIKVQYCDIFITYFVNIVVTNPIVVFEFLNEDATINYFFTSNILLDYKITLKYNQYKCTDTFTIVSSNPEIAYVKDSVVNFVGCGNVTISAICNDKILDSVVYSVEYKEIYSISSVNDLINIEPDKNYIVTADLDFNNVTNDYLVDNYNGEIDFNNKKLINLKRTIFNKLGINAVVKNMVISGSTSITENPYANNNFTLIVNDNYGTIDNVIFDNYNMTVLLEDISMGYSSSLLCITNNGYIKNITFNNTEIIFNNKTDSFRIKFSSIANTNNNIISNITGTLISSGFNKFAGIVFDNNKTINDVDITLNLTCCQSKQNIGGIVYNGKNNATIFNIDLDINITKDSEVNVNKLEVGGIMYRNHGTIIDNITIKNINLFGDIDYSVIGIYCCNGIVSDDEKTKIDYDNTLNLQYTTGE